MPSGALADPWLATRAGLALALANGRYWTSVAPTVRRELARWQARAEEIEEPQLKALALAKLHGEGFHAEAAAMLATFAPRRHRASVVEAIVALELLYDYLDGLSERPAHDPLRAGERLFEALREAVGAPARSRPEHYSEPPRHEDGGYLQELSRTVALALARLPAAHAITDVARPLAARAGEAQTRMHSAAQLGIAQLRSWATAETAGETTTFGETTAAGETTTSGETTAAGELDWRELAAGAASSVLTLHALIAAAADPRTTPAAAARIAEAQLATCVVLTLLDGLVDHEHDRAHEDRPGYLDLFEDREELPELLGRATRRAAALAGALPDGARRVMLLSGVVAYYGSAPGAEHELARLAIARAERELRPLIAPTLAVMRTWRTLRGPARPTDAKPEDGGCHASFLQAETVNPSACLE